MLPRRKILSTLFILLALLASGVLMVVLYQYRLLYKSKAEVTPTVLNWLEQPQANFANEPVIIIASEAEKLTKLPADTLMTPVRVIGTWQNRIVKVVPDDHFPQVFKNNGGIETIQMMPDHKLFLGTYNGFAIKSPDDPNNNWENLTYYQLQLPNYRTTTIEYFVPTYNTQYEIYFGGSNVVRRKYSGDYEIVSDPYDSSGYLRNVTIIPYKDNDGVVAYRSNELYYLERGKLRKWLTPIRPACNNRDVILVMTTDTETKKTYGLIQEKFTSSSCQAQFQTFLYEFIFSSDPNILLQATKLGRVEHNLNSHLTNAFIGKRKDATDQKILYAFKKGVNKLYTINQFYTDGGDMVLTSVPITTDGWPDFDQLLVETKIAPATDYVWISAYQYNGIYLGFSFDYGVGRFIKTENTNIFANPIITGLTVDSNGNIYTAHRYLPGQFNNAMLTILEAPLISPTLAPTPTLAPSPTPTAIPISVPISVPTNIPTSTKAPLLPTSKQTCPRGQTKPFYRQTKRDCQKINRCGVSNCGVRRFFFWER